MPYTILIADDHDIIREGIKNILSSHPEYKISGEVDNGEEVLEKAENLKPDIILLDITMPKKSGLDILEQLARISPDTKVIIITMHRSNIYTAKAFKLGVRGYILKENVVEDLIPALRRVCRGETYISSKISQYLTAKLGKEGKQTKIRGELLTQRENDILRLVVEGKTAKEIAEVLFISSRTVENYKNALLKKLNLHKTADLIKYAIKYKIVEIEG